MPFILPLATALTVTLTYETLKGTKNTIQRRQRRQRRKKGNGI